MSAPATLDDFLSLARKSGVLDEKRLRDQFPGTDDLPAGAHECAAALVRGGLLTAFQAKQILSGRYRGFVLGVYKILQPLGKGGMGTVFLAEHSGLKRRVALKVLPADKAQEKLTLERFHREARAAAALDHPNIVRLHDISQGGGVHFLVMEYVDGNDLQSLMAQTGPLHYAQAAQYVAQAAAGLQHAHEKGFVHRDIKPANLMLTKDGVVKILDMGLARSFTDANDDLTGQLGDQTDVAGTADYISPEQALNKAVDERSDVYSLGSTMFSLISGHPPFRGSTAQKLMQHQMASPPELSRLKGVVPPALSEVVGRMMAKRPSDRYQSAAEVIDALGPWLPAPSTGSVVKDQLSTQELRIPTSTASLLSKPTTGSLPTVTVSRQKLWVAAGVAGVVLVGAVGLTLALAPGKGDGGKSAVVAPPVAPLPGPTNPNPNPSPSTNLGPKPAPKKPAPKPARPAAAPVYAVDFAGVPVTSQTIEATGRSHFIRDIGGVPLPDGVHVNQWNVTASGVYTVADVGGVRAVGLRQTGGNQGVQVHFKCAGRLSNLPVGETATARLTYSHDGTGEGGTFVEMTKEPYTKHVMTALSPTGGAWRTIDLVFTRPDAGQDYDLVVRAEGENGNLAQGTIRVRSVEVFEGVAPSPALYRSDFSSAQPFRATVGSSGALGGAVPELPPGWRVEVWNQGSEGEFVGRTEDGRYSLAVAATRDQHAAQVAFDPKNAGLSILAPNRDYEARFEVRVDDDVTGYATVQGVGNGWPQIASSGLRGTGGEWKTVAVQFRLKDGQTAQFTVGPKVTTPGKYIAVRGLEIVDLGGAAPAAEATGRVVYHLDLSGQQPFTDRGRRTPPTEEGGPWRSATKTGSGSMPVGWLGFPWHHDTEAEFAAREIDGQPALGLRTLTGPTTAMLFTPDIDLPAHPVRVRVEYRCESPTGGVLVRFFPKKPQQMPAWDVRRLPGGGGKWQTAEFDADLKGATQGLFEIHHDTTRVQTWIWVRAVTVTDPAGAPAPTTAAPPPATPTAAGKTVYAADLSAVKPFKATYQDGAAGGDPEWGTRFPAGVYAHCWKKASVAEFRAEATEKGPAVGVTNLNDEVSSQVLFQVEAKDKLTPGKEYKVRVEYRAVNDAAGKFWARLPGPEYTTVAAAQLEPTGGAWRTAEFTFRRGDQPVELGLENSSVGEGNTLSVRAVEVQELR